MKKSVAIVGGGVAGIVAAYLLQEKYQVSIFEAGDYLGGHTNTVQVNDSLAVDTGFIVLNDKTYPVFTQFLKQLSVEIRYADMSFGFYDRSRNFCYAGTGLAGMFADRSNLFSLSYYQFLNGIKYFTKVASQDLADGTAKSFKLGEYFRHRNINQKVIDDYIVPIGASIWSTPANLMLEFPAETYLRFFKNHGLLSLKDRPRWQTVTGGSQQYVKAFREQFKGEVKLSSKVESISRNERSCSLTVNGETLEFDYVVSALHADLVLDVLTDASSEEQELFSKWEYNYNPTILHTDKIVMPPTERAWASWNYTAAETDEGRKLSVTYDMNRLQGFESDERYLVTLSPLNKINPEKIIASYDYHHPQYSMESVQTQQRISELNGKSRVFFAGSYLGYGFHEDAVKSANRLSKFFEVEGL